MSDGHGTGAAVHAASTGLVLTNAALLDVHFEACRPEYEVMLRSVGLQPGWRVLDAGCGSGSYRPLIAEAVGPTGAIAALDLAPENVAIGLDPRRDRPVAVSGVGPRTRPPDRPQGPGAICRCCGRGAPPRTGTPADRVGEYGASGHLLGYHPILMCP